jgi:lipoprotein-anchoring transpeptidase ErfK/SrfK
VRRPVARATAGVALVLAVAAGGCASSRSLAGDDGPPRAARTTTTARPAPTEVDRLDPALTYVVAGDEPVVLYARPGGAPVVAGAAATATAPPSGEDLVVVPPYDAEPGWHEVRAAAPPSHWVRDDDVGFDAVNVVAVADRTAVDPADAAGGGEVAVYEQPGAAEPTLAITNPRSAEGLAVGPVAFLAVDPVDPSASWLQVHLPIRPNDSVGWVRRADVTLHTNRMRVEVTLSAHTIAVYDGDAEVLREPVGVGTSDTPTPGGTFYIRSLIASIDPVYGTYAFGLSGFSDVHETFRGGPGDIGIHGTNDPDAVGTDVSNGCIRLRDDAVIRLARLLPEAAAAQSVEPTTTTGLGVPVRILP